MTTSKDKLAYSFTFLYRTIELLSLSFNEQIRRYPMSYVHNMSVDLAEDVDYEFLKHTLDYLLESKIIDATLIGKIKALSEKIDTISYDRKTDHLAYIWSLDAFRDDQFWLDIRQLAKDIFKSLKPYESLVINDYGVKNDLLFQFGYYDHSKAIIYAHLENQYPAHIIDIEPSSYLLLTTFDYHFAAGNIPKSPSKFIALVKKYIKENHKSEFILFTPNELWGNFCEQAFKRIKGIKDKRSTFVLDESLFNQIYAQHQFKHIVDLKKERDNESRIYYDVAYVEKEGKSIGFAKGFMIGQNEVEIDVSTDETYRKSGIAFETSLKLIKTLLDEGFKPVWSCWHQKTASINLALKLGFMKDEDIDAFIWTESFMKL